jgi:hypothetical protein
MKWKSVLTAIPLLLLTSTILICSVDSTTVQKTISVGGLSLGESLKDFNSKFPHAICGSPSHAYEILDNRNLPEDFDMIGCCIDDPEQISAFSSLKILSLANCHVLAAFNHERLYNLRFVVDVSSVDRLLPNFKKHYGPARLDEMMSFSGTHPQRVVSWIHAQDVLDLVSMTLSGAVLKSDPALNKGLSEVNVVRIHLWKMEEQRRPRDAGWLDRT